MASLQPYAMEAATPCNGVFTPCPMSHVHNMKVVTHSTPRAHPNPNPNPDPNPNPNPNPCQVEDLVRKNKEKAERAMLAASSNRAKMR